MTSKEWSALRDAFVACTPKTVAGLMAANPGIDLRGIDGIYHLAAEPADVTYEEDAAAGLPAIWANPAGYDTRQVLVYFHGGGFVSGSKDSHRKVAAHLAKAAGCRALIPDYRLAPGHTFPAQLEDAQAVHDWLIAQGYQPSKIAFAGDSSGANIATAAALALKRDSRPLPRAIVAFSPWYDMEASGKTFESNASADLGAGSSTTAQFAQHARITREELQQQQRDPGSFTIAKRVYIAIDDNAENARDQIAGALDRRYSYFGLSNLDAVAVAGTADDCVTGLRDIAAAGAHMILLNPLSDEIQQMQRLASEVIPRLS